MEPMAMPGLQSGMMTVPQRLAATGSAIARGFEQRAVNADHGVENRHHHEQGVQVDVTQNNGKFRVEEPFQWLFHESEMLQRGVRQTIATEQGNPCDHTDDIRRPKRNRTDEKQSDLPGEGADVKG